MSRFSGIGFRSFLGGLVCHVEGRIRQLISQAWHTYEFRSQRPTPIDEAKGGFATLENSLWYAVPQFARELDDRLQEETGIRLPIDAVPVRFSSWMGGDRDGNPFVTAKITKEVLLLSRWMAADLYLRDLKPLIGELSMSECSDKLREAVGDYARWDENDRQTFLLKELQNPRPLLPVRWTPSDDVKEVIDTCRVVAEEGKSYLPSPGIGGIAMVIRW